MALTPRQEKWKAEHDRQVERCRLLFTANCPQYTVDVALASHIWLVHVGRHRLVAKFLAIDPDQWSFFGVHSLRSEVFMHRFFGVPRDGRPQVGPQLHAVYFFNKDGKVLPEEGPPNYDVFVETTHAVLVMQRFEGTAYDIWPLLGAEARKRFVERADVLVKAIHDAGYIHGDLHTRNVAFRLIERGMNDSDPQLQPFIFDWGRSFRADLAHNPLAKEVLACNVYQQQPNGKVLPDDTFNTVDKIRTVERHFWSTALSYAGYASLPFRLNDDGKRRPGPLWSGCIAYWMRQLTGWPIVGLFREKTPVHYWLLVPTQPAGLLDETGLFPRNVAKAAMNDRYHLIGPTFVTEVDDVFSDVALFMKMVTNWEQIMPEPRHRAIAIVHSVLVKHCQITVRDPATLDSVQRGFNVGQRPRHLAEGVCAHCGAAATHGCARCRRVHYCGRKCQEADWASHARECRQF